MKKQNKITRCKTSALIRAKIVKIKRLKLRKDNFKRENILTINRVLRRKIVLKDLHYNYFRHIYGNVT